MKKEVFFEKLNRKSFDTLAEERIHSVLLHKHNVEVLFKPYFDLFDVDDLDFYRRVIMDAIGSDQFVNNNKQLDQKQEFLRLYCVFENARDAMRDNVVAMCHNMREDHDFAGLTELHDAVLDLPYNLYLPLSYLIFNDIYDDSDAESQKTENGLYQHFASEFEEYFKNLRQQADDEWATYQNTRMDSIKNNAECKSSPKEMTMEYLQKLLVEHLEPEDILLLSVVQKRAILGLAFMMQMECVLRSLFEQFSCKMILNNDYQGISNMIRCLIKMEGINDELREKCAGMLVTCRTNAEE